MGMIIIRQLYHYIVLSSGRASKILVSFSWDKLAHAHFVILAITDNTLLQTLRVIA